MKRPGRILIVEDRVRWQQVLRENLERDGFAVDTVATTAEVRAQLEKSFYHLIILDIRLDETDYDNTEGMALLQELSKTLSASVAIMMLSGYGTKDQMRAAFRDFKVVDFLEKQSFDNVKFRQQIQQMFSKDYPINLDLNIFWQDVNDAAQVVLGVKVDRRRVEMDTPLQQRIAGELDDLLCRLFAKANNVIVKPLIPGYSGTGVLRAQPFYEDGGGAQDVIVKFGDAHKIDQEYRNFEVYVRPFIGGGRRTAALNAQRTARLGGIVYSLLGATGRQQEDFGSIYRRASVSHLKEIITCLFRDTCAAWYANLGQLQPHYLNADYEQLLGLTLEQLAQKIKDELKSVTVTDRLSFRRLDDNRTFKDPLKALAGRHLVRSTYVCITHGDLNERNILVDQSGQVWLIDFQQTGPSHIFRDVANLDATIRFQLLPVQGVTLAERLALEENLSRITHFSKIEKVAAEFQTDNPALAKAHELSIHLRLIARQLVAQNPNDDFIEYLIASLYHALNHIRFSVLAQDQREHALMSASLLAEQLNM